MKELLPYQDLTKKIVQVQGALNTYDAYRETAISIGVQEADSLSRDLPPEEYIPRVLAIGNATKGKLEVMERGHAANTSLLEELRPQQENIENTAFKIIARALRMRTSIDVTNLEIALNKRLDGTLPEHLHVYSIPELGHIFQNAVERLSEENKKPSERNQWDLQIKTAWSNIQNSRRRIGEDMYEWVGKNLEENGQDFFTEEITNPKWTVRRKIQTEIDEYKKRIHEQKEALKDDVSEPAEETHDDETVEVIEKTPVGEPTAVSTDAESQEVTSEPQENAVPAVELAEDDESLLRTSSENQDILIDAFARALLRNEPIEFEELELKLNTNKNGKVLENKYIYSSYAMIALFEYGFDRIDRSSHSKRKSWPNEKRKLYQYVREIQAEYRGMADIRYELEDLLLTPELQFLTKIAKDESWRRLRPAVIVDFDEQRAAVNKILRRIGISPRESSLLFNLLGIDESIQKEIAAQTEAQAIAEAEAPEEREEASSPTEISLEENEEVVVTAPEPVIVAEDQELFEKEEAQSPYFETPQALALANILIKRNGNTVTLANGRQITITVPEEEIEYLSQAIADSYPRVFETDEELRSKVGYFTARHQGLTKILDMMQTNQLREFAASNQEEPIQIALQFCLSTELFYNITSEEVVEALKAENIDEVWHAERQPRPEREPRKSRKEYTVTDEERAEMTEHAQYYLAQFAEKNIHDETPMNRFYATVKHIHAQTFKALESQRIIEPKAVFGKGTGKFNVFDRLNLAVVWFIVESNMVATNLQPKDLVQIEEFKKMFSAATEAFDKKKKEDDDATSGK